MEKQGIAVTPELAKKPDLSKAIEKLNPVEVVDADGATRQIFTFTSKNGNAVQAMFYTREELPFNKEAIEGKKAVVLGAAPKHRDVKEWNQFLRDVQTSSKDQEFPHNAHNVKVNQAIAQNEALFMVENTPQHIIDLAMWLGVQDKELQYLRQKISRKEGYGEKGLDLIDDMVAGTIISEEGQVRKRQNQEGEALTVLALTGDLEARAELDKRKAIIQVIDEQKAERLRVFAEKRAAELIAEGVRIPDLVQATHVTKYKPEITPDGVVKIKSAFDGSDETKARGTVHFSLNGPISSAFGGAGGDISWENMPYKITGDLTKMRDANGNPIMVNSVDTYFAQNPGQPLLVPEGHVTLPGILPPGVIRQERGQVTIYKNGDFVPQDIDTLFAENYDQDPPYQQEQIDSNFKKYLQSTLWLDVVNSIADNERAQNHQQLELVIDNLEAKQIFNNLRTLPIDQAVEATFQNSSNISDEQKERLAKKLEGWLAEKIRNGTFYDWVKMGAGGGKEDMLLGYSWGTKGSDRPQAHAEDGDGGWGLDHAAEMVFKKVQEAEDNRKRWEQRKADAAAHPEENRLIAPWPESVYYDFRREKRVVPGDRENMMEAFRENRFDLTVRASKEEPDVLLPQNRRMYYLAGII